MAYRSVIFSKKGVQNCSLHSADFMKAVWRSFVKHMSFYWCISKSDISDLTGKLVCWECLIADYRFKFGLFRHLLLILFGHIFHYLCYIFQQIFGKLLTCCTFPNWIFKLNLVFKKMQNMSLKIFFV